MAYFGKEFAFQKEENFEAFVASFDLPAEQAKGFLSYKPNQKIEKDGDGYKFVVVGPAGTKEAPFKAGVPVQGTRGDVPSTSIWTVDGDTFTQVEDFGKLKITYKREFSANELKVTATTSNWNGVAYRWYTAA